LASVAEKIALATTHIVVTRFHDELPFTNSSNDLSISHPQPFFNIILSPNQLGSSRFAVPQIVNPFCEILTGKTGAIITENNHMLESLQPRWYICGCEAGS
jgi:hypothetical protein